MRQSTPNTQSNITITRRQHLQWLAALGAASQLPLARAAELPLSPWPVSDALFGLGVASGEPTSNSVVLWTRLLPSSAEPLLRSQTVQWEIAHDEQFKHLVHKGEATASPDWGHSVHVDAQGLEPERWYFYRFHCSGQTSATGRTRTAPAAGAAVQNLRLVFASCQRWEHGYYAAWRHARNENPDLVLFLGDYIYEYASPKANSSNARALEQLASMARLHPLHYPRSLQDYRDRYALHKSDPDLQAMHAHCPWLVTWDDHEVENDYAALQGVGDATAFARKRLAAYQAFFENMPLRATVAAKQKLAATELAHYFSSPLLYRPLAWGQLADLQVLDARQHRDIQACRMPGEKNEGSVKPADCADLQSNTRSFLGWEQERWLAQALQNNARSRPQSKRWNVICQQTLFCERNYPNGRASTDSWGGYPAARQRLINAIAEAAPRNTVLLGGDIHQNYVCRIENPEAVDAAYRVVASEFCGTSITSHSGTTQAKVDAIVARNPQVLFARCEERGYGVCDITPSLWTTQLRTVVDPLRADSGIRTQARFVVQDRLAGPQAA
ncbi:alkaline phosphatase D family protein [Comamonas sp. J-3]|uniref:alkaline phosphatase D family protein n=1 Tax=Comamonas trifloxystrobinivorans TaxID=3350256 RepID=UPI003729E002